MSSNRTIAIVGMGAIGHALACRACEDETVAKVICFSRREVNVPDKAVLITLDDYSAEILSIALRALNLSFDAVIIALGILHEADVQPEKRLKDLSIEKMQRLYQVNTMTAAIVIQQFIAYLPKKSEARIAAISARVGSISDNRMGGWYSYRMSKAALNMFIKTLSIELGRTHKQAIAMTLHPGTVDSALSKPFQGNVPEGKLFTAAFSSERLWDVIHQVEPEQSGACFAWDGQRINF